MSHQLDLDNVAEKLFVLEHLARGSEEYCLHRLAGSEQDHGGAAIDEYWVRTKCVVSTCLLEAAVRLRILQETVDASGHEARVRKIEARISGSYTIGEVTEGSFTLTLRESCNKIIHASKAGPRFQTSTAGPVPFEFWNGQYCLSGRRQGEPWGLTLYAETWARAMVDFLDAVDSTELSFDVGQDDFS